MKATLETLDGLSEALKTEYELKGGKYVLKLEGTLDGFVPRSELDETKTKLDEFRTNNIALMKERDELKTKFKGIDPSDVKTKLEKLAELEKAGAKDSNGLQALIEAAVGPVKAELEREKAERERATKAAATAKLHSAIKEVFSKTGGRVDAGDYAIAQAEKDFVIDPESGEVKPTKPDGKPLADWMTAFATKAAFAFEPSKGGGAPPSGGSKTGGTGDRKVLVNPTPEQLGQHAHEIGKSIEVRFE